MTLQFPLHTAAAAHLKATQEGGGPTAMGLSVGQLPLTQHAAGAAPYTYHDLMAWIMAGNKVGAEAQPAAPSAYGLQLDADALARELNGPGRCGHAAEEHIVPQAPSSPDSTLEHSWASPARTAPWDAEAGAPKTPELRPAPTAAAGKRKAEDHELMQIQPRTHRRKALHPHRAAEAVAEDWDIRASPARTSPPPPARKHDSRRHSPERIHRKPVPTKPARTAVSAATAPGSTVAKECHDCHTLKTPMWRRVEGLTFCNACGLRRTRALVGR